MLSKKYPSALLKDFLKNAIGSSKRVLDLGCGDGVIAFYLASRLKAHVDGVDMDKGKVHRANQKFDKNKVRKLVSCHICDATKTNKIFKKNTFDAVVIIHTFHHLTNIGGVLLKTRYVLKSKGKIFVVEYQKDYGEKIDNCPRFSNKKIKTMLKTAGFKKIKEHNLNNKLVIIRALKN
ncbi:class I SAM-dependent methyltransferase [Candidatus Pacearchaeota archaeon]|nr:class I SAM-dependent methyltransferase [Candidatus Pacearchaeota archaeon]